MYIGQRVKKRCVIVKKLDNYFALPIINHLHNDIENGQIASHYHIDSRFLTNTTYKFNVNFDGSYLYSASFDNIIRLGVRVFEDDIISFIDVNLKCNTLLELYPTEIKFIKQSKLKHKCIIKNKCPHRGYDLSDEIPKNGVITCPLHSLKFDSKTFKLI